MPTHVSSARARENRPRRRSSSVKFRHRHEMAYRHLGHFTFGVMRNGVMKASAASGESCCCLLGRKAYSGGVAGGWRSRAEPWRRRGNILKQALGLCRIGVITAFCGELMPASKLEHVAAHRSAAHGIYMAEGSRASMACLSMVMMLRIISLKSSRNVQGFSRRDSGETISNHINCGEE